MHRPFKLRGLFYLRYFFAFLNLGLGLPGRVAGGKLNAPHCALGIQIRIFVLMLQQILVLLIFVGAIYYVGRLVYKSFQSKAGCASGCSKCGAVDFAKIEAELKGRYKV